MRKSDEFLNYYNKIDKELIKAIKAPELSLTFKEKIKTSNNKVIKQFKDDLISFHELRNAIVHEPRFGNNLEPIAEPHQETVNKIREIYNKITNPPKVYPAFGFKVLGAKEDEYINDILAELKTRSFSQFPVFNSLGRVVELINTNTIARWVSATLEKNGTILIEDVKVADLLSEIEFKENYMFVPRDMSIYEAYELFLNHIKEKRRNLDALFITNSGEQSEKLLGLITIEDISGEIRK